MGLQENLLQQRVCILFLGLYAEEKSGVLSTIRNAERRGYKCKYIKVAIDDEDEDLQNN